MTNLVKLPLIREQTLREPFLLAKEYALAQLEQKLPGLLSYHSIYHTRDEVYPAAERLANLEGITAEERMLLLTATLYHDLGFIVQVANHEAISAEIAAQVLPGFGYSPRQVSQVLGMILVTKLFTPPKTLLEAIMVDADLDVLGRADFLKRNNDLRREFAVMGMPVSDEYWLKQQIVFMNTHRYRTISAQSLRSRRKAENLRLITHILTPVDGKGGEP